MACLTRGFISLRAVIVLLAALIRTPAWKSDWRRPIAQHNQPILSHFFKTKALTSRSYRLQADQHGSKSDRRYDEIRFPEGHGATNGDVSLQARVLANLR